jgi:hypothetical protein
MKGRIRCTVKIAAAVGMASITQRTMERDRRGTAKTVGADAGHITACTEDGITRATVDAGATSITEVRDCAGALFPAKK